MSAGGPTIDCVACGTPTPRGEMFGAGTDLRCGDCAHHLRERLHPAAVRRGAARHQFRAHDVRASGALIGLIVVLWVAQQMAPVARHLLPLFEPAEAVQRSDGSWYWPYQGAWQPALMAIGHFELWHVAMNVFFLWRTTKWIELGWGSWTMLFLVLGSAVTGSAMQWLLQGIPGIGVSGGAFGILGWLIAQRRHHVIAQAVVTPYFWHSLAANCVLMVVLTEAGGMNVSHIGHAAGFLFGLLAGWALTQPWRALGFALLAVLPAALCYATQVVEPLAVHMRFFGRG